MPAVAQAAFALGGHQSSRGTSRHAIPHLLQELAALLAPGEGAVGRQRSAALLWRLACPSAGAADAGVLALIASAPGMLPKLAASLACGTPAAAGVWQALLHDPGRCDLT